MSYEIPTTWPLGHLQIAAALLLSILGFGWFFFLSTVIRLRSLDQIKNKGSIPILETVVPTNFVDIFYILNIKFLTPRLITCLVVIFGLVLTSFEGVIVLNTISMVELCGTSVVITQAKITNDDNTAVLWSHAEVDAMMQRRRNSSLSDGTLVGQVPVDSRWRFDPQLDVDPYPLRSSCLTYKSGMTQVNMNTSVLHGLGNLYELLPEVHSEYIFRNTPDGYNYTDDDFRTNVYYNRTIYLNYTSTDQSDYRANGALILAMEFFERGNFSEIGAGIIFRMWTLRVPETTRIPYQPSHPEISEIVSVPIVVKAYTCEVKRVKEGNHGSHNMYFNSYLEVAGDLVARKWSSAVVRGKDTSIYEYTPEHWASYQTVKDVESGTDEEVSVRINIPCVSIDYSYCLLVWIYIIMISLGCIFRIKIHRNKLKIPSNVVGWVICACKESISSKEFKAVVDGDDKNLAKQSEFREKDSELKIEIIVTED
nr:1585_t:CDS:1 [Entrophospora candida]